MRILALDTSTDILSVALKTDEGWADTSLDLGLKHAERLMDLVDFCLSRAGMRVEDVDLFACAAGPGSFTGLRIGMATVKGLALAGRKPFRQVDLVETAEPRGTWLGIGDATVACVLVDEAQFLTPEQVWQVSDIADALDIPVLCYGLRTDFQGKLFPGSAALLERRWKKVARLGGDEFVVLLESPKGLAGNRAAADKIRQAFAPPFEVDGRVLAIQPSTTIESRSKGLNFMAGILCAR